MAQDKDSCSLASSFGKAACNKCLQDKTRAIMVLLPFPPAPHALLNAVLCGSAKATQGQLTQQQLILSGSKERMLTQLHLYHHSQHKLSLMAPNNFSVHILIFRQGGWGGGGVVESQEM